MKVTYSQGHHVGIVYIIARVQYFHQYPGRFSEFPTWVYPPHKRYRSQQYTEGLYVNPSGGVGVTCTRCQALVYGVKNT